MKRFGFPYRTLVLVAVLSAAQGQVRAQTQTTSVPYLRAAIGSLSLRDRVTFTAVFDGQTGLREATGRYLRGKGYSRFTVSDPTSGLAFDAVYCLQNSKVFTDLIQVRGRQTFVFYGYKDRGEEKEDAVVVTQVERVGNETSPGAASTPSGSLKTYRVTLTDLSTSNETVIVNVELGKAYRLLDSQIVVEEESAAAGGVQIIGQRP